MEPKKFSRLCTFKGFLPNVTHYLENERYCTHKQILFNQTADILLAWFLFCQHILERAICKSEKIIKLQMFHIEPEQQTHALNAQ